MNEFLVTSGILAVAGLVTWFVIRRENAKIIEEPIQNDPPPPIMGLLKQIETDMFRGDRTPLATANPMFQGVREDTVPQPYTITYDVARPKKKRKPNQFKKKVKKKTKKKVSKNKKKV